MLKDFHILFLTVVTLGFTVLNGHTEEAKNKKLVYQASFYGSGLVIFPANDAASEYDKLAWTGRWSAQTQLENAAKEVGFSYSGAPAFAQQSLTAIIGGSSFISEASTYKSNDVTKTMSKAVENQINGWKRNGIVVGIPETVASNHVKKNLDIIKKVSLESSSIEGISRARMREVARQAAEELFTEAASFACNSKILPDTISPSLSVSFNFFAGAEFSIEATFKIEELCAD